MTDDQYRITLRDFYSLPDAYPDVQCGEWVLWDRSKLVGELRTPVVMAQVTRVAKDKTWADITWRIPEAERTELQRLWDITHRSKRVKTIYLRLV